MTEFRPIVDLRHGVAAAYEAGTAGAIAALPAAPRARHPFFLNVGGVSDAAIATGVVIVTQSDGVESWDAAESLLCHGVEWAEGCLFGPPAPRPEALEPEVSRRIAAMAARV